MEKAYHITLVNFYNEYFIIEVDDQLYKFLIKDISNKLFTATSEQRNSYRITPSGYGIHWNLLDEDLSINGLLKLEHSIARPAVQP